MGIFDYNADWMNNFIRGDRETSDYQTSRIGSPDEQTVQGWICEVELNETDSSEYDDVRLENNTVSLLGYYEILADPETGIRVARSVITEVMIEEKTFEVLRFPDDEYAKSMPSNPLRTKEEWYGYVTLPSQTLKISDSEDESYSGNWFRGRINPKLINLDVNLKTKKWSLSSNSWDAIEWSED